MTEQEALQLHLEIVSRLLGCVPPDTIDAMEQRLRTALSPALQETRRALHQEIVSQTPAMKRRWVQSISSAAVSSFDPRIVDIVNASQAGEIPIEYVIELFLSLGVFEYELLQTMAISWIALSTRERLSQRLQRLGAVGVITPEHVMREHDALVQEMAHDVASINKDVLPTAQIAYDPIVIQTTTGVALLSGNVHLYDVFSLRYAVSIETPRAAYSFDALPQTVIPWNDARHGVVAALSFPDAYGVFHDPVSVMLSPQLLQSLSLQARAIPLRMGVGHDIMLHSDYFPHTVDIGAAALATIRRTPQHLEVRKMDPDLTLTLFA